MMEPLSGSDHHGVAWMSKSEELNDGFSLPSKADGLNHITLGAETVDELGDATVRVIPKDAPHHEFDSVQVLELAGEPTLIAKEAIRVQGEAHLIPSTIWPYREIEEVVIPMDDGRLEAADGELIGVNADGQ